MINERNPASSSNGDGAVNAGGTVLVINPSVNVIRSTSNEVFVEVGTRSRYTHRISDDKSRGLLADFVLNFEEAQNVNVVVKKLGIDEETRRDFVEYLTRGRVLLPPEQVGYSYLLTGFKWNPAEHDVAITILGQGRVAEAITSQLSELVPHPVVSTSSAEEAFDDADFVIAAMDGIDLGLCYDADELSRATQTPWHLTRVDGFEVLVGPTFIPGSGVNYYDLDTMDEAARVMRTPFLYSKAADPEVKQTAPLPAFVASIAAGWTTVAAAQHLWGKGSFLEDHIMRIDLERMEIIRDKVLRLPRNPVDMGMRADLRHPFL